MSIEELVKIRKKRQKKRKAGRTHLLEKYKYEIIDLYNEGKNTAQIKREIDDSIGYSSYSNFIKKLRHAGEII